MNDMKIGGPYTCQKCGHHCTGAEFHICPGHRPEQLEIRNFDKDQPCLAEQCAEQIRKERNLPKGAFVPVMINCPCPKCNNVRC